MKKFVGSVLLLSLLGWIGYAALQRSTHQQPLLRVDLNQIPEVYDKAYVDCKSMVMLVDLSSGGNLRGVPVVAYLGKTITVSCPGYRFGLMKLPGLIPGKIEQQLKMYSLGQKVEIKENSDYLVAFFNQNLNDNRPIGKLFFLKSDEEDIRDRLRQLGLKYKELELPKSPPNGKEM